jgi:ppGpp synthetase/RelA/SpoT-type nucleotidyltranferase
MLVTPDKTNLENEYNENYMYYKRMCVRVGEILQRALNKEQIRTFPPLENFRVKDFESFYSKIIRNSYESEFFNKIEDIAGVRIICIYFDDLDRIGDLIANNFIVERKDRKSELPFKAGKESGYLSDHYIVTLSKTNELSSDQDLMKIKCEIQARTVLMHGWATVSHELNYKKTPGLNKKHLREMIAVSSLLYVADQRFDAYRKAVGEDITAAVKSIGKRKFNLDKSVTSVNLIKYLRFRFPLRDDSDSTSYEQLEEQLNKLGLNSFKNLDKLINSAEYALKEYEKEHPPGSEPGKRYDRVGATRICITLMNTSNKDSTNFYIMDRDKFRKKVNV